MFPTAEVRWFYHGQIPTAVLTWFEENFEPETQPARVDYYLRLREKADSLGIKLREGKVEVKPRYSQPEVVRFHDRVVGRLALWRKWSFLLDDVDQLDHLITPASSWIDVKKERQMCAYRRIDDRLVPVSLADDVEQGCEVELAALTIAGRACWSLCFEAYGDEPTLTDTLHLTAKHVLTAAEPPGLDVDNSYSYPGWLNLLDEEQSVG